MSSSTKTIFIITKQRIFSFFILLLFIPLFQMVFPVIKEKPLDGLDPPPPFPEFTLASWMNEKYQKSYSTAVEQNIGFHSFLVRLRNQINYSVFGFSEVADVVVGKDGQLFLKPYTNALTGEDFVGSDYINIQVQKMKVLQTELKKKNIDLFVVLAPGKGTFYSEYIPDNIMANVKPDSTNYACYKRMFSEQKVNCLDLNSYFLSIKKDEKYPLYSTTGVHWTEYGCYIGGKEIVTYIEKIRKINLPDIKLQSIEMLGLSGNRSNDYEVASIMNIFTTIPHPMYAIPKLQFVSDSSTTKPDFLCIADSYFAGITNTGIPSNAFSSYHYWLYNDRVYSGLLKEKKVRDLNLKNEIEKQDVICLLATNASLPQFPFGFIDRAYELYAKKDANYYALKNKEFRNSIQKILMTIQKKESKEWKAGMIESAKRKGVSEMDEFIENAIWVYQQEQIKIKGE